MYLRVGELHLDQTVQLFTYLFTQFTRMLIKRVFVLSAKHCSKGERWSSGQNNVSQLDTPEGAVDRR